MTLWEKKYKRESQRQCFFANLQVYSLVEVSSAFLKKNDQGVDDNPVIILNQISAKKINDSLDICLFYRVYVAAARLVVVTPQQTGRRHGAAEACRSAVSPGRRTARPHDDVDGEQRHEDGDRHGRLDSRPRRVLLTILVPAVIDVNNGTFRKRRFPVDSSCQSVNPGP